MNNRAVVLLLVGAIAIGCMTKLHVTPQTADSREAGSTSAPMPRIFQSKSGAVLTDNPQKAVWAIAQLETAATQFEANYQINPPAGLIVDMPFMAQADKLYRSAKAWTLPWKTDHFGIKTTSGPTASGAAGDKHGFNNVAGLRHELTHLFFTASIIPSTKHPQYGSDAADWLDEAVAIAAEPPESRNKRRSHFYRQVCAGRLVPLNRFIRTPHPLMNNDAIRKVIREGKANNPRRPVMLTADATRLGMKPNEVMDFYAEANAVADFLREESGDDSILRTVAEAEAGRSAASGREPTGFAKAFLADGGGSLTPAFETWSRRKAQAAIPDCRSAS